MTGRPGRAVLPVGGHESVPAQALGPGGERQGPGGGPLGPGRGLRTALADRPRAVAVPVTLGRDPDLAASAAQTLAWAARDRAPGDLLLAEPLGTVTHLVGWIRAAVLRLVRTTGFAGAALLVAPAAGPDADAELCRVARLVWDGLPVRLVEVAFAGGEPDAAEGVERCRRLGAGEVALVPASFVPPPPVPGTVPAGPLLQPAAVAALVRERAAAAERRWEHDADDGLSAAEHHGHSHSHHHEFLGIAETTLEGAAAHGG
ncbi:hypothetical protein ABZ806_43270 [Spirillospora sp. NPDC047418]